MHYVYVLQNADGILYKGYSENIEHRLLQHNTDDSFASYTSKRGPWKLVYKEEFGTKKEAILREKFFKTGKGRDFLKQVIGRLSA